jgi:hypothetical protein
MRGFTLLPDGETEGSAGEALPADEGRAEEPGGRQSKNQRSRGAERLHLKTGRATASSKVSTRCRADGSHTRPPRATAARTEEDRQRKDYNGAGRDRSMSAIRLLRVDWREAHFPGRTVADARPIGSSSARGSRYDAPAHRILLTLVGKTRSTGRWAHCQPLLGSHRPGCAGVARLA